MAISEYKLQRSGGGDDATLHVSDSAVTLDFKGPVSAEEREALEGVVGLGKALGRKATTTEVSQDSNHTSVSIPTNGKDLALAAVMVNSLESHGAVPSGESGKVRAELAPEKAQGQEAPEKAAPPMRNLETATALLDQLKAVLTADAGHTQTASKTHSLPGVESGVDKGIA